MDLSTKNVDNLLITCVKAVEIYVEKSPGVGYQQPPTYYSHVIHEISTLEEVLKSILPPLLESYPQNCAVLSISIIFFSTE